MSPLSSVTTISSLSSVPTSSPSTSAGPVSPATPSPAVGTPRALPAALAVEAPKTTNLLSVDGAITPPRSRGASPMGSPRSPRRQEDREHIVVIRKAAGAGLGFGVAGGSPSPRSHEMLGIKIIKVEPISPFSLLSVILSMRRSLPRSTRAGLQRARSSRSVISFSRSTA